MRNPILPILAALGLSAAYHAKAATVVGSLRDVSERPLPPRVTVTPLSTPLASGTNTLLDSTVSVNASTEGLFSVNLAGGLYLVQFGPWSKPIRALVPPDDTNTYTLNQVAAWATNVGQFTWTNPCTGLVVSNAYLLPAGATNETGAAVLFADDLSDLPLSVLASGTPNTLLAYNASGAPATAAPGAGLALSGGVLSVTNPPIPEGVLTQGWTGTIAAGGFAGSGAGLSNVAYNASWPLNTNVWVVPPPTGSAAQDMANIQYALDMATNLVSGASYGGVTEIILAGGQYNLSGSLTCRMHGVTIRGQGMERTRLYQSSSTAPAFVVSGISGKTWGGASQLWYVTFRDFQVTKTRELASTSTSAAFHFVTPTPSSQQLSRARFENVKVNNFFYGWRIEHAVGVTWLNCEGYGCNHSYWLEKCDSAVFINCFGGDGIASTYYTNQFGTNWSTAWTYKPNSYADGFDLTIIGGEARYCNAVLDAQGGNINVSGLNIEQMPNGPVFWLQSGVDSADIRGSRIARLATNNAPVIRMASGVASKTRIHGLDLSADLSSYPPLEIQGASDWLAYTGPQITVTNTALSKAYYAPAWRERAYAPQVSGLALDAAAAPPPAAYANGGACLWNSNGTLYLLTSSPGSTAWAATNKIAP